MAAVLLENGALADIKDKNYTLPLHKAAEYKNVEVAKLLLQHR